MIHPSFRACLTGFFLSTASVTLALGSATSIFTESQADKELLTDLHQLNPAIETSPYLSASDIVRFLMDEQILTEWLEHLAVRRMFGSSTTLTFDEYAFIDELTQLGYEKPLYNALKSIRDGERTFVPAGRTKEAFAQKHIQEVLTKQDPKTPKLNELCIAMKFKGLSKGLYGYPVDTNNARALATNPYNLTTNLTPKGNFDAIGRWIRKGTTEEIEQLFALATDPNANLSKDSRDLLLTRIFDRKTNEVRLKARSEDSLKEYLQGLSKNPLEQVKLFAVSALYNLLLNDSNPTKQEFLAKIQTQAKADGATQLENWATIRLLSLEGKAPAEKLEKQSTTASVATAGIPNFKYDHPAYSPTQNAEENRMLRRDFFKNRCLSENEEQSAAAIHEYIDTFPESEFLLELEQPTSFLRELLNSDRESVSHSTYAQLFNRLQMTATVDDSYLALELNKSIMGLGGESPLDEDRRLAKEFGIPFSALGKDLLNVAAQSRHKKVALWAIRHRVFSRLAAKDPFPFGLDQADPKLVQTYLDLLKKWHGQGLTATKN